MANFLPSVYQPNWGYSGVGQQVYPQAQQSAAQVPQGQNGMGIKWVDGEVGAKAFQMPAGWPPNLPVALWDTNDTVIYLKSVNPMGMPNPLQKARYRLEDVNSGERDRGYSGEAEKPAPDMTQYVKKEDLERMKQELIDTIGAMQTSGTGVRRTAKGES